MFRVTLSYFCFNVIYENKILQKHEIAFLSAFKTDITNDWGLEALGVISQGKGEMSLIKFNVNFV